MSYYILNGSDVQRLRTELIGKFCKNKCAGVGALFQAADLRWVNCDCTQEFSRRVKLLNAGIPKKYWDFTFKNLLKDFKEENTKSLGVVQTYCEKVATIVPKGGGLYIQGASGLAKSALGYYILKSALKQGIVAYAIRMSQLTGMIFDSLHDPIKKTHLEWMRDEVQLLMIDEIEKDNKINDPGTFAGAQVNEFFGEVYDSQKSLIVTSNVSKDQLKGIQADNVIDRLAELVDVILVGASYRRQDTTLNDLLGD
jgi:DNA replication protein DnaC